jgi:nucleoside-diphosphate-sugar epimerase
MHCLVTGVAGFIGSHLAERLLADGHTVCGIDNFIDSYPRSFKEHNLATVRSWQGFTFIEADLLELDLLPLMEGVDWLFHQAAQAGVRASWGKHFSRYVRHNLLTTQRLLEASRRVESLRRFVYASSSSVYGDAAVLPLAETVSPCPISPYGVTKLAGEHLCMLYYQQYAVPIVSLRYFTVYGPRQRPDMAFHRFCKSIIDSQPLYIYDDGQQTRDFTYISDVIAANLLAASQEAAIGRVFNIAGGAQANLHHVVALLREISGSTAPLVFGQRQAGDVRNTYADTRLAQRCLGYKPRISLYEGLAHEFENMLSLYKSVRA